MIHIHVQSRPTSLFTIVILLSSLSSNLANLICNFLNVERERDKHYLDQDMTFHSR